MAKGKKAVIVEVEYCGYLGCQFAAGYSIGGEPCDKCKAAGISEEDCDEYDEEPDTYL